MSRKLKKVPPNAKVLYPDKKWRDATGNLTSSPSTDTPTYRINADGTYTKVSLSKLKKEIEKKKTAKKPKPPEPRQEEKIEIALEALLAHPIPLATLLGMRILPFSREQAETIQEATANDLKRRLEMAVRELEKRGIEALYRFSQGSLTIDCELDILIPPNVSLESILKISREVFKIPPGTFPSIGWRFEQVPDLIQTTFPLIDTRTGAMVKQKTKDAVYQIQSGYIHTTRAINKLDDIASIMLKNLFQKHEQVQKPTHLYIRVNWNPFKNKNGDPLVPTRQE